MSRQRFSPQNIFLLSGLLVCMTAPAAYAGFEWKGPLEAPTAAPASAQSGVGGLEPVIAWDGQTGAMPAQKIETVEAAPMTPPPAPAAPVLRPAPSVQPADMPVDAMPTNAMAAPADAEAPVPPVPPPAPVQVTRSISSDEAAAMPAAGEDKMWPVKTAAAPSAAPLPSDEVVNGFGSGMPLVMALQQIVPAGYQFAFSTGVNPGAPVSWEGGKSWKEVLADALKPQGFGFHVQDNILVIDTKPGTPDMASSNSAGMADDAAPGRVLLAGSDQAPAASMPGTSSEPVYIRREKPKSLFSRIRDNMNGSVEADVRTPDDDGITASSAPMADDAMAAAAPANEAMPAQDSAAPLPLSRAPDAPANGTAVESLKGDMTTPAAMGAQGGEPTWTGAKGQTLRDVLKAWSDTAGVELYWSIDYDYRLQDDASFFGTFDEAVGKLLDGFASVRPQPFGELHQSNDGPRVLVIKSYDVGK